jgi:hypothetical protein
MLFVILNVYELCQLFSLIPSHAFMHSSIFYQALFSGLHQHYPINFKFHLHVVDEIQEQLLHSSDAFREFEHVLQLIQFYEGLMLNLQDQNGKDFFLFPVAKSTLLPQHLTIITILSIDAPQCLIIDFTVLLKKAMNLIVKILSVLVNFED